MRGVLLCAASVVVALFAVEACSSDEAAPGTSSSGGNVNDASGNEEDASASSSSGDASKDSGSVKNDAAKADTGSSSGGAQLTIEDGNGGNGGSARFAKRSFADYTCPEVAGLGKVVEWPIPQDIATATNLPAGSSYVLRIEGAAADNVIIKSPAKTFFAGDQPILITPKGTLPPTTLESVTPATGSVTVRGDWSCP